MRRRLALAAIRVLEEGPPGEMFSAPRQERTRRFLRRVLH
ncbi:MAG: hypothetical protein AVDCRST_MAG47-2571 [uncultured Nocardioidaceae bacterium]|uniref:Uncharacterized protein n=1 Tax=uncultured Nocardioidaceae bacterium TaxID=253824 RepID=A0A6J4NJU6_9ACTN|nr:MAG: hypothetical protein AVDCRST_MAG47-2571 [uncultured Nocardioidaceae bacterium]